MFPGPHEGRGEGVCKIDLGDHFAILFIKSALNALKHIINPLKKQIFSRGMVCLARTKKN